MHGSARCGHTEYDKGHCSQPGCPNDLRACTECSHASIQQRAREDVRQMWQAAFGCDPS